MADASAELTRFKVMIFTADSPLLGPQRRAGTFEEVELNRKLTDYFASIRISSEIQPLLRSASLLWHDHLDASHAISQGIETRDGSWLHGIMHRREPDYGNAKYWFRRVGTHETFTELADRVEKLLHAGGNDLAGRLVKNDEWQPLAFVDACERAGQGNDAVLTSLLRQIQAAEFDVLIEHIFSHSP